MALPNKDLLTPGPWIVNGNTVKDAHGRTIAVCFSRNATAHAYWVAEIPTFAESMTRGGDVRDRDEEIEKLEARIAELERENERLNEWIPDSESDSWETDELEHENEALKLRVEFLEARVKSLENTGSGGR